MLSILFRALACLARSKLLLRARFRDQDLREAIDRSRAVFELSSPVWIVTVPFVFRYFTFKELVSFTTLKGGANQNVGRFHQLYININQYISGVHTRRFQGVYADLESGCLWLKFTRGACRSGTHERLCIFCPFMVSCTISDLLPNASV